MNAIPIQCTSEGFSSNHGKVIHYASHFYQTFSTESYNFTSLSSKLTAKNKINIYLMKFLYRNTMLLNISTVCQIESCTTQPCLRWFLSSMGEMMHHTFRMHVWWPLIHAREEVISQRCNVFLMIFGVCCGYFIWLIRKLSVSLSHSYSVKLLF